MKHPFPQAATFFTLLILNTLTAFIYNFYNEIWFLMPIRIGAAFINGLGVTLITVLTLHYIHKYLRLNLMPLVMGVSLFVLIIESFLLLNFYTLITPSIIMVMLETNKQEASEFFASYFDIATWVTLLLIFVTTFFFIRYRHKLNNIHFPGWFTKKAFLIPACCFSILVYIGLTYYVTQIRHMTSYQALTGVERVYHSIRNTLKDQAEYKKYLQLVQQKEPVLTENLSRVPYVAVILGESLSKLHMNAYGYSLPTTPKLNERLQNKETIKCDSVITPKTVISLSIRNIMTFYEDTAELPWYRYHTLPAVMQAAGYKTYWLSNQDSFNTGDNNSTAGIASTSSVVEFAHQRHASEERYGYFDEDILPLLDSQMQKVPQKAFLCLHLMGSHRRYTNRYPANFGKFGIEDIKKDISTEKKQTIAEYDNSVLYNDSIIDEIIKRFEKQDAIVFYFPDHGEEVYDTRNMCGHGLNNPSAPMREIPFLIWTSATFKEKHPKLIKRMQSATNRPFNTTNLIHTIMDICGIQTQDYQAEKSLLYTNKTAHSLN